MEDEYYTYYVANEWIGVVYDDKSNGKVRWYYIDEKLNYAKGFKQIDGYIYYFDDSNEMFTGDLTLGTMVYHFSTKNDETLGSLVNIDSLYKFKK